MPEPIRITPPLSDEDVMKLKVGDRVLITGKILTGRDSAHKRLYDLIQKGEALPIDITGQIIYYVGPAPAKPGSVIGSAGPTTSYRMDPYAPLLMEHGLKGMIGKGVRSQPGALIAKNIKAARIIAYEDLGPEAIRELEVADFPVVVANDAFGGDLYEEGMERYRR
jgi:fumarate hydratase subunit beta